MSKIVEMGDIVKDLNTGYEGKTVSKHEYINGCLRWEILIKVKKGADPSYVVVDDQFVELVKKGKVETSKSHQARVAAGGGRVLPGGPQNDPSLKDMMRR